MRWSVGKWSKSRAPTTMCSSVTARWCWRRCEPFSGRRAQRRSACFLSSLNEGAPDDPRVELRHRDVREVLAAPGEPFDLVIGDLTDPDPAAEAAGLLSPSFFAMVRRRL